MEYFQYFRLKGPPFQPASLDGAVYLSPTHIAGLATLESGLSGELTGLTMLTGEAGTGKTTLIYSLLQRDFKRVRIALIEDPKLSFLELMRVVMSQMNLYSTGSTKLDYLDALQKLLKMRGGEERIAIVVDEAQLLSDDVLEELRLLSNRSDRSLQLILVGHPELAERLKQPHLRQLNQRISSRGALTPLTSAQAIKYIECKLSAQSSNCAQIFERGALKRLLRHSEGIPRKINMLCHTAMEAAYNAGEKKVTYKTARAVADKYREAVKIERRRNPFMLPAAGLAFAVLLLVAFVYPSPFSARMRNLLGRGDEQAARLLKRIERAGTAAPVQRANSAPPAKPVEAPKPVEQAKPVEQVKTAANPTVEQHPDTSGKPDHVAESAPAPAGVRPELLERLPAANAVADSGTARPPSAVTAPSSSLLSPAPAVAAASAAPAAPAAPAERRNQITVRAGDTLEKIAVRYLGTTSGINAFIAANPQLTNVNQLTVGQVIYLPPGVSPKAAHADAATEPAETERAGEPAAQPAGEPAEAESAGEPATGPATDSATEPAGEPATEPSDSNADDSPQQ
jgi:type II secretory pathway predicted ATPase ExeA/LysM repeat protein